NITLAHVIQTNDKPKLLLCKDFPIPNFEEKASILAEQVSKLGLENNNASYVLSPDEYKLLLVEAPDVGANEIADAVKWKIKDLLDNPVEEMAITVFPVPDDAYRGQTKMVYVVAALKSKIREIVELVTSAELELVAIDIPELVMMNLSAKCADDSNGLAFLDLRGSGSTMNLCKDGSIYLTRHLNTRMDEDVLNSVDWDNIRERLVLEIQRSLDYYESQLGKPSVNKVLLAPRQSDSEALAEQLNSVMSVRVECMDISKSIDSPEDLTLELQEKCLMAIGGALRQERAA
ncbi:MAG: MSHA biogenesis protein MshI, partial [Pseudohongiellaceae bacterium]